MTGTPLSTVITGTYNIYLVGLSYIIAVVASFTTLSLAGRLAHHESKRPLQWLLGGAGAMGFGIWSMHFVGMLALTLPMNYSYNVSLTLFSLLVAIFSSGFALYIGSRPDVKPARLCYSGMIMGLGIAGMHYVGMIAMEMEGTTRYEPNIVALSIVIAIIASIAALWLALRFSSSQDNSIILKIVAAFVMGLAITGMHYTGMAAATLRTCSLLVARPKRLHRRQITYGSPSALP